MRFIYLGLFEFILSQDLTSGLTNCLISNRNKEIGIKSEGNINQVGDCTLSWWFPLLNQSTSLLASSPSGV